MSSIFNPYPEAKGKETMKEKLLRKTKEQISGDEKASTPHCEHGVLQERRVVSRFIVLYVFLRKNESLSLPNDNRKLYNLS